MGKAGVFISYRREDSAGYARLIYERLHARYPGQIFMDVTNIQAGVDFREEIEGAIGDCRVVVLLIGKQWATVTSPEGIRRLDDPNDFVRLELAIALQKSIAVLPTVLPGAVLPASTDLPESLTALTRRQAIQITETDFDKDIRRLISVIDGYLLTLSFRIRRRVASIISPIAHSRKRQIALLAGAGMLVAVIVAVLLVRLDFQPRKPPPLIPERRTVAVLGFKNLSGRPDYAWLSTALSEMLTTELAAGEGVRMIAGEDVSQMKINLSLTDADSYGKATLSKIRANSGSDDVVLGSYVVLGGGQIRLDLRLQDAVAGETLVSLSETGTETQIDDVVSRAGATLRKKLGLMGISTADVAAVKATLPSNPEALKLYTNGLAKLRAFDALAARSLLEKAVTADPQHALAHSALAMAWLRLGYDEKARAEAKRAFELSANLSRENRFSVEGMYRATVRELEKVIEIYQTLWGFFPDNIDYGLQLAAAQTAGGKGREALTTVEALRKLPAPASQDPRIDMAEADAAASISDFGRQLSSAEKALAKGSAQDMRLLVARAQLSEGDAFRRTGEFEKAISVDENAEKILTAAGDLWGAATALHSVGIMFMQRGELSRAEEIYKKDLAIRRKISDKRGIAETLLDLGRIRRRQDDLPAAKSFYEESLSVSRDINDRSLMAAALNSIGVILQQTGQPDARKNFEEALSIFREIGRKEGIAVELNNIAFLLELVPDLPAAKRTNEEAFAIRKEIGDQTGMSESLDSLGGVLFKQGDLSGAQDKYEQALTIRTNIGEKGLAAATRVGLAEVSIEKGQAVQAERFAREAALEFQREKAAVKEAQARSMLALSQLAQERVIEAQQSIDAAGTLLGTSKDRSVHFFQARTAARVRAAGGDPNGAIKDLDAVVTEAEKLRWVNDQLEARLALGEIEMKSGKTASGRPRLSTLEKEATATGFLLIARKARIAAANH